MGIDVFVDSYAATASARRFADHYNLGVVFDVNPGQAPWADGKNIHLECPKPNWNKKQLNHWWAKFIHETKHMTPRGRKAFEMSSELKLDMDSLHGKMINLFEDACINNVDTGKFIGMDETLSGYLADTFKDIFGGAKAKNNLWNRDDLTQEEEVFGTSMLMAAKAMESYMPDMIGQIDPLVNHPDFSPKLKELYEKGVSKHLAALKNEVENVESSDTRNVWDWMNEYMEDLWDIPPPPPPPPEGESKGDEEGDGKDGDGKGDPKEGKGTPGSGDPENGDGEVDDSMGEAVKGMLQEWTDDHSPDLNQRRSHRDMYYDPPDFTKGSGKYDPPSAENFIVANFKEKKFCDGTMVSGRGKPSRHGMNFHDLDKAHTYHRANYESMTTQDSLSKEIKRHIQSESRVKIHRNIKKGKLDAKKLFKLGVPDAGKDWQEKVFWEKVQKSMTKDTIISVGGDFSGSMSGSKILVQMKAMELLDEVLTTLGVNHELWGFTCWGACPTHFLFKQFGERVRRPDLVSRMLAASGQMENNNDGDNVLFAYNRLLATRAKRRIMVVMSDGAPSGPGGDINWWTKEVANRIQDQGIVEMHGIGIMSESPKYFYRSHEVIKAVGELEPALLRVLKNKLIKVK